MLGHPSVPVTKEASSARALAETTLRTFQAPLLSCPGLGGVREIPGIVIQRRTSNG
jgi:hypothetical protein